MQSALPVRTASRQEDPDGGRTYPVKDLNRPSIAMRTAEALLPLWLRVLRQEAKFTGVGLRILARRNQLEKAPVIASEGPIVSLTTYGKRVDGVYLTIESIARGSLLPSRLLLWLDDEDAFRSRPSSLRRLEDRGVEVRLAPNYGPHTKYYPYLESTGVFEKPLVTADDDIVYPVSWLRGLVAGFNNNRRVVSCYRAHVMRLAGDQIAPYLSWTACRSTEPSACHFATGVSGCIYPPALLKSIREAGTDFLGVCPQADDVWLHVNALRAGFEIKQLGKWPLTFTFVPGTQKGGISFSNVELAQNDIQIGNTYGSADIAMLLSRMPYRCSHVPAPG